MMNWKVRLLFFRLCIIWRCFSSLTSDKFSFAVRPVTPNVCVKRITSSLWCTIASSCTIWRNVKKFGILPHCFFVFWFVLTINTILFLENINRPVNVWIGNLFCNPRRKLEKWANLVQLLLFDVCVNVHYWYNNINNQLDATMTIY